MVSSVCGDVLLRRGFGGDELSIRARAAIRPASALVATMGRSSQFDCCSSSTSSLLLKGLQHLAEVKLGPLLGDRLEVAGVRPEIVAAGLGLGRDENEVAERQPALGLGMVEVANPKSFPGGVRRSADQEAHRAGRRNSLIAQRSTMKSSCQSIIIR